MYTDLLLKVKTVEESKDSACYFPLLEQLATHRFVVALERLLSEALKGNYEPNPILILQTKVNDLNQYLAQ